MENLQIEALNILGEEALGKMRYCFKDGKPWFIAKDVCDYLEIKNSRQALTRLKPEEKDVISNDTLGGKQKMSIVCDSGLYILISGSRKKEAVDFMRWIAREVLPSLFTNGFYVLGQEAMSKAEREKAFHAEDSNFWFGMYKKLLNEYIALKSAIPESQKDSVEKGVIVPVDDVTWTDESGFIISVPSGERYAILERREK